jgi:ABC-type multidrug transport system fused ATPase/permease subunit
MTEPLVFRKGESVALIGRVGSGKTRLLLSILGEAEDFAPITFTGPAKPARFAFVPQQPVLLNASIRENVDLFANLDPAAIWEALRLCSLEEEVQGMARGLDMEVGEFGASLSGGQKQRLSLARAVVHRPDVVCLDDPFSALDEQTEIRIADQLIFGAWSGTTRVVATHRLHLLERFDRILFLQEGTIVLDGPLAQLLADPSPAGQAFRDQYAARGSAAVQAFQTGAAEAEGSGRITVDEGLAEGEPPFSAYRDCMLGMSRMPLLPPWLSLALILSLFIAALLLPVTSDAWIALWSDPSSASRNPFAFLADAVGHLLRTWRGHAGLDPWTGLEVYLGIELASSAAIFILVKAWFGRALAHAQAVHDTCLGRLLGARITFFDDNPSGRVLNRFTHDLDALEGGRQLPNDIFFVLRFATELLLKLGVILLVLPLAALAAVPCALGFRFLQARYRPVVKHNQRLIANHQSHLLSTLQQTLAGLVSIRVLQAQTRFQNRFNDELQAQSRVAWREFLANAWFGFRAPIVTGALAAMVVSLSVYGVAYGKIRTGDAGLAILFSLVFLDLIHWLTQALVDADVKMVAVERLEEYARIPAEPSTEARAPEHWPEKGTIVFQDVSIRYRPDLPQVITQASFTVPSQARVGIVGRTGAGKTTLFQALLGLIPVEAGAILIDGVPIETVSRHDLRTHALAYVPQEPQLLSGTLRSNLDPEGRATEGEILEALEKVQLASYVAALPKGLDTDIEHLRATVSAGQKQLLCLSRALLSRARVILLDEATASVDPDMDRKIQQVLAESLADRTRLVIAHRLGSLEDYDFLLRVEDGIVTVSNVEGSSRDGETSKSHSRRTQPGP